MVPLGWLRVIWRSCSSVGCPVVTSLILTAMLSPDLRGADAFRAAVARVDITPAAGERMWGYFNRTSPATGQIDPLWGRVLLLESGQTRVVLVNVDLGRPFSNAVIDHLRQGVAEPGYRTQLIVAATHTHAGPVILDAYPKGRIPRWEEAARTKILKAYRDARLRLTGARIGIGYGRVEVGYNRRAVAPDGRVTMLWANESKSPTAPLDPVIAVLRVDSAKGEPLAVLLNYAMHPVVFGHLNRKYSADLVGYALRTVEESLGGRTVALFLQGGCGDINPYFATATVEPEAKCRWTGEAVGREAARVAAGIHTATLTGRLDFIEERMPFHLRWEPKAYRDLLLATIGPDAYEQFSAPVQPKYMVPVSLILVGRTIALLAMPGEPFVELQTEWRRRCPVPNALLAGYTNGYFGYFPTIKAAAEGGYGAASTTTWLEVGAGERMLDYGVIKTNELLGRLHSTPEH